MLLFSFLGIFFYSCDKKGIPTKVFFILLDAGRADHLSCYGYPLNTTPNIDELTKKGSIFLNNYSQTNGTILSMSQIFTSRYFPKSYLPYEGLIQKRLDNEITIFELMRKNGFKNIVFSGHPYVQKNTPIGEFIDEFFEIKPKNDNYKTRFGDILEKLEPWIEKNKKEKYFCYIHLMDTHFPHLFFEKTKFITSNSDKFVDGNPITYADSDRKIFNERDRKYINQIYDEDLYYTDKKLGILFNKLEELGILNDALIIITADHGDELLEHNFIGHGWSLYNEEVHTPLIFFCPQKIKEGTKINELSQNIDIFPTILDICKIKLPKKKIINGKSFYSLISKNSKYQKIIHDYTLSMSINIEDGIFAITDEKYKYISSGINPGRGSLKAEFYNFYDSQENHNIIEDNKVKILLPYYESKIKDIFNLREISKITKNEDDVSFSFYLRIPTAAKPLDAYIPDIDYLSDNYRKDNLWNLTSVSGGNRLVCFGPGEDPKDINLELEAPNGIYHICIEVLNAKNLFGTPASKIMAKVQSDHEFRIFCKDDKDPRSKDYIYLGKYEIKNKIFFITIRCGQKTHWAIVFGFRFYPENTNIKEIDPQRDKEMFERLRTLGYIK